MMIVLSSIPHKDSMVQATFPHLLNAAFQFKFKTGNIEPSQGNPVQAGTANSIFGRSQFKYVAWVGIRQIWIHDIRLRSEVENWYIGFWQKNKAFVIIEYKQDKNFSVVDQGYAYLSAMLNNKADFILEYNEARNEPLKRSSVDWSQSRIILFPKALLLIKKKPLILKIFRLLCGR